MAKTLDEIFDDDEFGLLDFKENKSIIKTDEDRLIDSFQEINVFFEKNKREPTKNSMAEYGLLSKLQSLRSNEKLKNIIKPFDKYNLLGEVKFENTTIEDIINDDDFGILDSDSDTSIFTFKHTPKPGERASVEDFAQRKPMSEREFRKYEEKFRQVHKELKEGKRKLQKVDNVEQKIFSNRYYLMDGLLLFLEDVDFGRDNLDLKDSTKSRKDGKTKIIFENGTISSMLYRSLTKQLYKNGKLLTEPDELSENQLFKNAGLVSEEDVKSGWIYVLRSKSQNREINNIKNLYKIGFSISKVEDRVKNSSNESTYLYDDVEIVATYKCYNLNVKNFENLLHRFFGETCLNIEINIEGKPKVLPREWFVVPLAAIDEVIDLIMSGGILNYKYDATLEKLLLK